MKKTPAGRTGPTLLTHSIDTKKGFLYQLYRRRGQIPFLVMSIIPVVLFAVIQYWPLFGLSMAFQDYRAGAPFISETTKWVGFKWFGILFRNPMLPRLIRNTLILSILHLIFGFPAAVSLALLLNEIRIKSFRKFTSTISLLPYFLSTVVIIALMRNLFSVDDGVVNEVLELLGRDKIDFMGAAKWFRTMHVGSGVWAGTGFSAVVYTAAIAGIDPELYDAAALDGSTRWKNIFYITIPSILPTVIIMLILNVGSLMSIGYEKIIMMYNPAMYDVADVISTYSYRAGIQDGKLSLTTALGLFNTACNLTLLCVSNWISKKVSGEGI